MSNQAGRPSVMDEDTVRKLEQAFQSGFSAATACHLSGISRSTFYEHLANDQEFSDKMSVAREWVTQQAKQVVVEAITNKDLRAAQWWLERKARHEFGPQSVNEDERYWFEHPEQKDDPLRDLVNMLTYGKPEE